MSRSDSSKSKKALGGLSSTVLIAALAIGAIVYTQTQNNNKGVVTLDPALDADRDGVIEVHELAPAAGLKLDPKLDADGDGEHKKLIFAATGSLLVGGALAYLYARKNAAEEAKARAETLHAIALNVREKDNSPWTPLCGLPMVVDAIVTGLSEFVGWLKRAGFSVGFLITAAIALALAALIGVTLLVNWLGGAPCVVAFLLIVLGTIHHAFHSWPGYATPRLPDLTSHTSDECVRVVALSDTHSEQGSPADVPHGDILVHAGDFTLYGGLQEVKDFNEWLGQLPHKHKFVIGGNHDIVADGLTFKRNLSRVHSERKSNWLKTGEPIGSPDFDVTGAGRDAMKSIFTNATYLEDEGVTVDGILIYGSPWQPPIPGEHDTAAFDMGDTKDISGERMQKWKLIPPNVDVLLTHTPPHGILDFILLGFRVGCTALTEAD